MQMLVIMTRKQENLCFWLIQIFSESAIKASSFYISYSEDIMNKYLFGFLFICYAPFYKGKTNCEIFQKWHNRKAVICNYSFK
jgi:hypothetical protein